METRAAVTAPLQRISLPGLCHLKVLLEPPTLISQSNREKRTTPFVQCRRGGWVLFRASLQHITLCHFLLDPPIPSPSLGLYIEPYTKNAFPLPPSLFNLPVKELQLRFKSLWCHVAKPPKTAKFLGGKLGRDMWYLEWLSCLYAPQRAQTPLRTWLM